jgi:hypothetical protein
MARGRRRAGFLLCWPAAMAPDQSPPLQLRFYGDLGALLKHPARLRETVLYPLARRASIKDIIESLGIPHTEIGRLQSAGGEVGFSFLPAPGDRVDVHPVGGDLLPTAATVLRPEPLRAYRFLVDVNVSRLASLLRMAGFDAASVREQSNLTSRSAVASAARQQERILVSRDRELLKLRTVIHGRLIRNQDPTRQLHEVVTVYRLQLLARPFSRCMKCNRPLAPVAKEAILSRLEPLTKKYYSVFSRCPQCENIYWQGSHYERMLKILDKSEVLR